MTVSEVIAALSRYPGDCMLYVLDVDGTTQPAKQVAQFPHLNTPPGIAIPDDVWILPWMEGEEP